MTNIHYNAFLVHIMQIVGRANILYVHCVCFSQQVQGLLITRWSAQFERLSRGGVLVTQWLDIWEALGDCW